MICRGHKMWYIATQYIFFKISHESTYLPFLVNFFRPYFHIKSWFWTFNTLIVYLMMSYAWINYQSALSSSLGWFCGNLCVIQLLTQMNLGYLYAVIDLWVIWSEIRDLVNLMHMHSQNEIVRWRRWAVSNLSLEVTRWIWRLHGILLYKLFIPIHWSG